jgi:hypothetical protein
MSSDLSAALPPLAATDATRLLESSTALKRTAWLKQVRAHFRSLKA